MRKSHYLPVFLLSGFIIFICGLPLGCKKANEDNVQQQDSAHKNVTVQEKKEDVMNIFVCGVCGHLAFGSAPENCPVCFAPKDKFTQNNDVFTEAEEKSAEAAVKHIPAITVKKACQLIPEQSCVDVIVRIGETLHPMVENHYIHFIDCYVDDKYVSRVLLTPGVFAAGCFHLNASGSNVRIVEFCNLHGHWQAETEL